MTCDTSAILKLLAAKAHETADPEVLGRVLVDSVSAAFSQASWVGIYWLRGRELVLGPYSGAPTEHTRIAIGEGVCGTAIAQDRDVVVPDVREVANYLACSPKVRSEIVVLIRAQGQVVGQIDADSEAVNAFGPDDHCVLKAVADSFGGLIQGV